jgi:hypothetical protein
MTETMAEAVQGALPSDNELVVGVVAAVNPLTVSVRGALISRSLGVLGSYIPAVGDNVQIIRQDASWLVLGVGNNGTDASLTLANYNSNTAAATTVLGTFTNVNPVRFAWTKRFASTRVRVDLSASCFTSAIATKPRFGVDFINVAAVPPSPRVAMMEMLINTANEHVALSAQDVFSGFGVGTYQVQLIWLRVAGAGTLTINADDWVSLMVTEVA